MPHSPPCAADEVLWGDLCYPKFKPLRIDKIGDTYSFVIGGADPDMLPTIARSAGDDANVQVKKNGQTVDVNIDSVAKHEASKLLEHLDPASNIELPV